MKFHIALAVDSNFGIGKLGHLPWPLFKTDMNRFKALTEHQVVIMGRKTYDSLPANVRPLPNRDNIVVTRNSDLLSGPRRVSAPRARSRGGAYELAFVDSFDAALMEAGLYGGEMTSAVVMGGADIYAQAFKRLPQLAKHHPGLILELNLTRVVGEFVCDTFLSEDTKTALLSGAWHCHSSERHNPTEAFPHTAFFERYLYDISVEELDG